MCHIRVMDCMQHRGWRKGAGLGGALTEQILLVSCSYPRILWVLSGRDEAGLGRELLCLAADMFKASSSRDSEPGPRRVSAAFKVMYGQSFTTGPSHGSAPRYCFTRTLGFSPRLPVT